MKGTAEGLVEDGILVPLSARGTAMLEDFSIVTPFVVKALFVTFQTDDDCAKITSPVRGQVFKSSLLQLGGILLESCPHSMLLSLTMTTSGNAGS